ncbi:hypothetical protein ACWCXX_39945 [Streptomyces sp. NPDC001732]
MSDRNADREHRRFSRALESALTLDEVASAYLNTVGRVVQADGLDLYMLDIPAGTVVDIRATAGGGMLNQYEAYGRPGGPVLRFVVERRSPIDSSRVVVPQAWGACGARQAFRTERLAHSMEAPLIASGVMYGTITFARRPGSRNVFGEQDLASARVVGEELELATERALRHEATVHRATALEHALDQMAQAVVVTDLDGQLLFQNRIARRDWNFEAVPVDVPRPGSIAACIGEGVAALRDNGRRVFTRSVHDGGRKAIVKTCRPSERDDTAVTVVFPCAEETAAQRLPIWEVLTRREQEIA